jgi:hypothetical protein
VFTVVIGTPFVGRRRELDLLRGKLFAPGLGTARFVGVTGEPGMGKTRLLAEFAAAAAAAGVLVMSGRAGEFERHVPFGVLLGDTLSTVDIHGAIDVERYQLHRAIRTRLVELAAQAGVVLLLDDASLELLDHLVRHPPRARVVIVAACRPRQAPPRLSAALSDGVEEIELAAFSFAEIDLQVARAVADVAEPTLVAAAADLPLTETLAALDRLTERDLLRPLGTSGGVRCRHPLLRSVVYQGIGSGWRFAAHARTAAALAASKAPATIQAHHVEQSAGHGDKAAIDVLVEAAVAHMNTAPSTAAHWRRTALRLLPADPAQESMRLVLLGMLAKGLGVTGEFERSREALHEVLTLMPAEPAVPRAQVVGFCAQIERLLGRHPEAHALVLGELNGLSDPDSAAAAVLELELAAGTLVGGNLTDARLGARGSGHRAPGRRRPAARRDHRGLRAALVRQGRGRRRGARPAGRVDDDGGLVAGQRSRPALGGGGPARLERARLRAAGRRPAASRPRPAPGSDHRPEPSRDVSAGRARGRRLGIATGTVQKHLENSYRKLGAGDRLTSVLRAQALGLLPRT